MVDDVGGSQAAPQSLPSLTGNTDLGRDEFLKLLVAKLQNQDPLKPAEDTQFVAELATFSSLEQLIGVNDNLEGLAVSQTRLLDSQALGMIGQTAVIDGHEARVVGGEADTLVYEMPRLAKSALLHVRDESGTIIRTIPLNRAPNGRVEIDWARDADGNPLADGNYRIDIEASDASGNPMTAGVFRLMPIDGAHFYNGGIQLVSGGLELSFGQIFEIQQAPTEG